MENFRFRGKWIWWIESLIKNTSFFLLVVGSSFRFFKSKYELRQGDLLSPTLFVIVEEVLSKRLKKLIGCGQMKPYYEQKNVPPILHALFINDMVIFKGNYSVKNLIIFFKMYEKMLGQRTNRDKSLFYMSQTMKTWRII